MLRRNCAIVWVVLMLSSSLSHAVGIDLIMKNLATEAGKAASSEVGKSAVDYFKKMFNRDANLAKEKQSPQLVDAGSGEIRKWLISPAGTLSKSEIKEIAKTLKTLDHNREQSISINVDNNLEEILNTQVDNKNGLIINSTNSPVTLSTQSGAQGLQIIGSHNNPQVNINSPNAVQNVNKKRTIQKQFDIERGMEGSNYVLNLIFSQTKGIWDSGEKFAVFVRLSGPFIDYRFLSGLPMVRFDIAEKTDKINGVIYYSTRTPLINEPVLMSIRSKSMLDVQEVGVNPIDEE